MAQGVWKHKDLLGLGGLSPAEIEAVLDAAAAFKKSPPAKTLQGRVAAFLFSEPSTRTRSSFEIAAFRLGAHALGFAAATSSLLKGETLLDTVKNLEAMGADYLVLRQEISGALAALAPKTAMSLINAGDGSREHPTQALLDLMTIREKKGRVRGLRVVFVGDVLHSRVARSGALGLRALGARVTFCGPRALAPDSMAGPGVSVSHDLDSALKGADVIYALRLQLERQKENFVASSADYREAFGVTARRAALAPEALIMHGGPLNRGVEIDPEAADGPRSAILDMVANGVCVRMAVFSLLGGWREKNA